MRITTPQCILVAERGALYSSIDASPHVESTPKAVRTIVCEITLW